ncbi:MAG: hypothetical protein ACFE8N_08785 [Promethearchaeota archaeon]
MKKSNTDINMNNFLKLIFEEEDLNKRDNVSILEELITFREGKYKV